jgi:hypothetical protein
MDPEENERVALPADEAITWPCMWLTELYAPSHAEALEHGLAKLERGDRSLFHGEDVSGWMRTARSWTGGFRRVGSFRPDEGIPFGRRRIGLPSEFSGMQAELSQVAPGITILKMQFVLAGGAAGVLDGIMRQEYATRATPLRGHPGGQEVRGPQHRKEDEITAARARIRAAARRWVTNEIPGLFSGLSQADPPAWDLLLTRRFRLNETSSYDDYWRSVLGFGSALDEWIDDDLSALTLVRPYGNRIGVVPSLVGVEGEAMAMPEGKHYGEGLPGLLTFADRAMSDTVALWTLWQALGAHEKEFGVMRDQLAAPPDWYRTRARLRRLRREVMPLSFDLETLGEAATNDRTFGLWTRRSGTNFKLSREGASESAEGDPPDLMSFLHDRIREQGDGVVGRGKAIAGSLRIQGDLLVAASNARIQWFVVFLTIVVGVAGVVATLSN